MSVIIRLQNLPWSANALDIRNFFQGLSIPEGGVHIVGGELGDAFIAFSTDEDARQAMMLDGGKIKEIQVKLLLSSRSEMHKVIEAARQSVPILTLTAQAAAPTPATPASAPTPIPTPTLNPFAAFVHNSMNVGIPGLGNPQEIPQPAVIEPPSALINPAENNIVDLDRDDDRDRKRSRDKERRRSRSKSRSRSRDRKDRKRDRRDRSRSRDRDRRRRDRSRSRERRDRGRRDRKERSRSRDYSPTRRSRDRRDRKSPFNGSQDSRSLDVEKESPLAPPPPAFGMNSMVNPMTNNGPMLNRFSDPAMNEAFNKLQELGKKRNPNAFQGDQNGGSRFQGNRSIVKSGFPRRSRFDDQQKECCVAIRNAPNHTSYGDVRRFFPFMIDKHGIKMINDNMGRRTGNIYVRFCEHRSKQLALQRKHNELKGEAVIVESLDDDEYDNAVDSFLPYRDDNDAEDSSLPIADVEKPKPFSVIKLTELPHFVKEHDIIKAFSEFSLLSIILHDCKISRTKTAYVQFVKSADAQQAFDTKEKYVFGRRQPNVSIVTDEEFEKEKAEQNDKIGDENSDGPQKRQQIEDSIPRDPRQRRQNFDNSSNQKSSIVQQQGQAAPFMSPPFSQPNFRPTFPSPQLGGFPGASPMDPRAAAAKWANRPQMESGGNTQQRSVPNLEDEPLDCVLMKGLPRDATDRTIVTFLADTGAVPARIHLMLEATGSPSGDCFCEFRSSQEARLAATKHGHNLNGCRITVDLVTRSVVEEALEGPKPQAQFKQQVLKGPQSLLNSPRPQGPMHSPNPHFEQQGGLLGNAPAPFFNGPPEGFGPRGFRGRNFDRGGYRGGFEGRGGFGFRGGFDRGSFRGRGRGERGRGFDGRGGFERGRGRGFMRGRGGFENGHNQREVRDEEPDPGLEDFGAPGCVVTMENVPFRASIDDILNFFSEFELTQDDVIRRYNERGLPTGDARVSFRTPVDAQRAVSSRHMQTILERRVSLAIL